LIFSLILVVFICFSLLSIDRFALVDGQYPQ
jgi:hypothetical protein